MTQKYNSVRSNSKRELPIEAPFLYLIKMSKVLKVKGLLFKTSADS